MVDGVLRRDVSTSLSTVTELGPNSVVSGHFFDYSSLKWPMVVQFHLFYF